MLHLAGDHPATFTCELWPVLHATLDVVILLFDPLLVDVGAEVEIKLSPINLPGIFGINRGGVAVRDRATAIAPKLWGVLPGILQERLEVRFVGKQKHPRPSTPP